MDISNLKVSFLGDSITVGEGASEFSKCYVGQFIEKYPNALIRSYCVGGSCISNKCIWGMESMCERIEKMDPDADVIVAFGGTNDFECMVPLGMPSDQTEDTFYGACHTLIQKLQARFPGKSIVMATPLHRSNENLTECNGRQKREPLSTYVDAILQIAREHVVPVIGLHEIQEFALEPEGKVGTLTVDGLHPNDEGYALLFHYLDEGLRSL